ncbi:DUF3089 domain-containing protein [Novosphingobium resinovorum]|uniref:DUF3089 domain-containing protein n=1 Tax=Novosphingobium resinovorum TaxID=158500 RepID=UPI002ED6AA06|nr:DUF3089 domain-containing protein [Novosphingobium resinovorum]
MAWRGIAGALATALALCLAAPVSAASGPAGNPRADAGPAPDYARDESWALHDTARNPRGVDVFYIHPTTFISQDWNQRMDNAETRAWTLQSVAERQVSAFAACCRRFMPFYRQASSHAFVERGGRGAAAYDIAYEDVVRAFHAYLAQSHGRPFIIAGHSQGALLGFWLLQREIAGTPLAARLVAAYLPGIGIPQGALPADVGPCLTPAQTRCLVSWNGFTASADAAAWTQRSVADYAAPGRDPAILCVNPITFDAARPAASAAEGKGMLPVALKGRSLLPMVPHPADAACQDGVLRVTPAAGVEAPPLPNGALHMHDIALFWADISANAALRARSWRKEHR